MSGLADIVKVTISRGTRTVTLPGFGTALFLGPNATALRRYTSLAGVLVDFTTSQVEYKAALAYFGQGNQPTGLLIGKRTSPVAQVVTLTPTVLNNQLYTVTVNGVAYSFTSSGSATATTIVTGLKAAITDTTVATSGTATLIITANVAGTPFTVSGDANQALVTTTASNGVADDIIAADFAARTAHFDWYMLGIASRTQVDIQNAAAQCEAMFKMFVGCTVDAAVLVPATNTDVASILKGKNYLRTALIYSTDQADMPEMAWMGACLPLAAGSETWKFKSLAGISPDDALTDSAYGALEAKNCNYYYTVGGQPMTTEGKIVAGDFIDNTRFIDWYTVTLQGAVYGRLINSDKVPYSDEGVSILEADARGVNLQAERVGGFVKGSGFVSVPAVGSISSQTRGTRVLPNFLVGGTLAGAIHSVQIQATVSV